MAEFFNAYYDEDELVAETWVEGASAEFINDWRNGRCDEKAVKFINDRLRSDGWQIDFSKPFNAEADSFETAYIYYAIKQL